VSINDEQPRAARHTPANRVGIWAWRVAVPVVVVYAALVLTGTVRTIGYSAEVRKRRKMIYKDIFWIPQR
jgi:hypothetical protein